MAGKILFYLFCLNKPPQTKKKRYTAKSFSHVHLVHMLARVPTVPSSHDSYALKSRSRTRRKESLTNRREEQEHDMMNEVNFLKNEGDRAD